MRIPSANPQICIRSSLASLQKFKPLKSSRKAQKHSHLSKSDPEKLPKTLTYAPKR